MSWRTGIAVLVTCLGMGITDAAAHQDHVKVEKRPVAPLPMQLAARDKVEVVEYFWYASTAGRELAPALAQWVAALPKDVVFRREHVYWGGRSDVDIHARLFATLRTMKADEAQLAALLAATSQGRKLDTDALVMAWVAERGIDPGRFAAIYRSPGVDAQVQYAKDSTSYFEIQTVPTFVINNTIVVSAYQAMGRPDGVLALVDEWLAKERNRVRAEKARGAGKRK